MFHYRPTTEIDLFHLKTHLQQLDWNFIAISSLDLEAKFEMFLSKITFALEVCFPIKTKILLNDNKSNLNWFTDNLRQMRESLHFIQWLLKGKSFCWFKRINRKKWSYKKELVNAKKLANDNYIYRNKNQQKAMWNLIKSNKSEIRNYTETISPSDFKNFFGNIELII